MHLKNFIKDHSTYIGIVLVQVILIGAGFVLLSTVTKKPSITACSTTSDIIENQKENLKPEPQITATSTERELVVNINTAPPEELELLPGIGGSIAQKIIEYRDQNGSFKTIEDIKNISGIGDKKFEDMKKYIVTQ